MSTGSATQALKNLDGSAQSVKQAASAMMKHYDQTAMMAVTEWRNVLSSTRSSNHLMSLLYVANEVLQISKRNRGNKFLEAFSGVLGQALQHICQQDPSLTEKVRRTVKIWGDRRVFSVRFVQELLNGLESYRNGSAAATRRPAASTTRTTTATAEASNLPSDSPTFHDDGATFSPQESPGEPSSPASARTSEPDESANNNDDDDSIMGILEGGGNKNDSSVEDDDDDDIFGSDTQLKIDIDLDNVATGGPSKASVSKRRRSSLGSTGSGSKRRRRNSATSKGALSATSLLELSDRVTKSQDDFDDSQRALSRIDKALSKTPVEELEQMVGDELQMEYRQVIRFQNQILSERKNLHSLAQQRRGLEQEAVAYLPWLERALNQDDDDLNFCDRLEKELKNFQTVHTELKKARDVRRVEEEQRMEQKAEQERKKREQQEAERFREETLKRETEQKAGMVWNPVTREYQTLDTNESWRDN